MSQAIAVSKARYMGDPGLFGFLGKVAKTGLGLAGMLPGVGGFARGISGAIFPPAPGTTTYAQFPPMMAMPSSPTGMPGSGSPTLNPRHVEQHLTGSAATLKGHYEHGHRGMIDFARAGQPKPGLLALGQRLAPFGETGMFPAMMNGGDEMTMRAGKASGWPGYHWNKSDYFLRTGEFVPAGSKMVRNRRRNPANARATSNSIQRIKSAKRYAKSLSAISIRKHHHH